MTYNNTPGPSFEEQQKLFPGIVHYDNNPHPTYEKCKRIIMTPVAIIRFIIALFGLFVAYVGVFLTQVIDKPTKRRQDIFHKFGMYGGLIARYASGAKVTFAKNSLDPSILRTEPVISNHVCFLDPVILYSLGATGFVSKASIRNAPMLGKVGVASNVIFVDRSSPESRALVADQLKQRLLEIGEKGLIIFPEGTTSNGRYICKFKTGIFRPGLPVRPVTFKYTHRFSNPAWGIFPAIEALRRVLSQIYTSVEVNVLPLYVPSEAEIADPELYAENVREYMSKHSGLPLCDTDANDIFAYSKFANGNLSWEECLEKTSKK